MNRRQPLIQVTAPELISSGLWPDRHPGQVPLWVRADNCRFAGGKVQRRVPNSPMFTAGTEPVRGIGQHQDSSGTRWVYASSGGDIKKWYGPAPTTVASGLTFQEDATSTIEASFFDFTPWGNWMIVNNRLTGVFIHKPGDVTPWAALANAPDDAVQFLKKRNQLLALGYGLGSRLVGFSDADDITNWTASADNLAGEIPLEELDTPMRAACHFGKSVALFGENQLFAMNWIGQPFVYNVEKLLDGIGAVGKASVCSDGRTLYGVSRNGVWRSDGLRYDYIDEVVLRDYLQENVNWAQGSKIACEKNDISGCIEFSFPMRGSLTCNEAWAYDPRYNGWSQVPYFEIMARRVLFDKPIQGQASGAVQLIEDFPTVEAPLFLETAPMLAQQDKSALHVGALIDEIEVYAHKCENVHFQYGCAEYPGGPFNWTNPWDLNVKMETHQTNTTVSGVWHKLRFESFEDDWTLDLQGIALFGVPEGQKKER